MRDSSPSHFIGLDIGTSTVRCVIGILEQDSNKLSVIGYGSSPNIGMRKGAVVHVDEAVEAVVQAVTEAAMDVDPNAECGQFDPVVPLPGVTLDRDYALNEASKYTPDQIVELTEKARRIPMAQLDTAILHRIGNMTDRSRMGPLLKELVHRNQPSSNS